MRAASFLFVVVAVPLFALARCIPAVGAEIRSGDEVVIKADEVIDDDLYVFGRNVTIDGTVEGDVVAFAQQVTINGTVKGHIMAAGQTVILGGKSDGARVAGQAVKVDSKAKLDGDLLAAGMSLECSQNSTIIGDTLFAGYQGLFAGEIRTDLRGAMSNCRLAGQIGGDVNLKVGDKNSPPATTFGQQPPGVSLPSVAGGLTVAESATVDGDLLYRSADEANIDPQAKVGGDITHLLPEPKGKGAAAAPAKPTLASKALGRIKHLICVGLVGLLGLVMFPRWSTACADTIRTRPGASLLSGLIGVGALFVLLIVLIFAIVVGAVLLSLVRLNELVPMMVVGGIVGYAALIVGFWLLAAFLAEALAGLAIGRSAVGDDSFASRAGALIVGILLLGVVLSIPYLGTLLGLIVVLFGVGSICLWIIAPAEPQSFAVAPPIKAVAVPG